MINFKGMSLTTSVNVYVPSDDSFIAADVVENLVAEFKGNKLDVLDMGSGTGILGLVAAKSPKVSSVIFADINEDAVKMCKENVNLNANLLHAKCVVKMSDLFSNVDGKFDILIFNAPYLRSDKEDEKRGTISKSWAGGPEGIDISIKFLKDATNHLRPGAKVVLVASSLSNLSKLKSEIKSLKLKELEEKKLHIFFEDIVVLILSL